MVYCCVPLCKSKAGEVPGISFHEFPSNAEEKQQWQLSIRREWFRKGNTWEPSDRAVVCSKHFLPSDFSTSTSRKKLLPKSVPTVFGDSPEDLFQPEMEHQSPKKRQETIQGKQTMQCSNSQAESAIINYSYNIGDIVNEPALTVIAPQEKTSKLQALLERTVRPLKRHFKDAFSANAEDQTAMDIGKLNSSGGQGSKAIHIENAADLRYPENSSEGSMVEVETDYSKNTVIKQDVTNEMEDHLPVHEHSPESSCEELRLEMRIKKESDSDESDQRPPLFEDNIITVKKEPPDVSEMPSTVDGYILPDRFEEMVSTKVEDQHVVKEESVMTLASTVGERSTQPLPPNILHSEVQLLEIPGPSGVKGPSKSFLEDLVEQELLVYESDASDISLANSSDGDYIASRPQSDDSLAEEEMEEQHPEDGETSMTSSGWNEGPIVFKSFPFNENCGIDANLITSEDPYQMFRILFSDELLELIASETNKFAAQNVVACVGKKPGKWKDLSRNDLMLFFSAVFNMGLMRLPRLRDYWRKDFLYKNQFFNSVISRDKFLKILGMLHFANNETVEKDMKLWKCKPIIDYFNNKMHKIHVPFKQLAIDESVLFRNDLECRQNTEIKRNRYGIKFYMLSQSNGFTQKIFVYGDKGDPTGCQGRRAKVVNELMSGYMGKGYSLFMNSSYNSVPLSMKLLKSNTHTTGTFSRRRKGSCQAVVQKELNEGETYWKHQNGVVQMKWHDTEDVLVMSTEFKPDLMLTTNIKGDEKRKPEMFVEYVRHMTGINAADQQMFYYNIFKKSRKWYKKVAFKIIHLLMVNAKILYNIKSHSKMTGVRFQELVINGLLREGQMKFPSLTPIVRTGHYPDIIPDTPGSEKAGRKARRRCRHCRRNNKCSRTSYFCIGCPSQPPLCISCFKHFEHE